MAHSDKKSDLAVGGETLTKQSPATVSSTGEVDAFLKAARSIKSGAGQGRLIFALDATMSRQPTWDMACGIQADMFREAGKIGSLAIQLVYFRGFGECRASKWASNGDDLARLMTGIAVRGGQTQIGKILSHALKATRKERVNAMIYVGDCLEEPIDPLCQIAGELGLLGLPVFMFQEGHEPMAERGFKEIARLSGGAYMRFHPGSAKDLRELLSAVAVFATGGHQALSDFSSQSSGAVKLIGQMKK
ncbi:MAG: VWA domain-containing protein [Pseudomonadota bacterium]